MVSSDGFPPPRAAGTARASGCRSRKSSGRGTPWIACRSTHTLATERAAMTSSARSARARAAGERDGRTPQLTEDVEVTGGLAGQAPGGPGRHPHPGLDLGLGPSRSSPDRGSRSGPRGRRSGPGRRPAPRGDCLPDLRPTARASSTTRSISARIAGVTLPAPGASASAHDSWRPDGRSPSPSSPRGISGVRASSSTSKAAPSRNTRGRDTGKTSEVDDSHTRHTVHFDPRWVKSPRPRGHPPAATKEGALARSGSPDRGPAKSEE